MKKQLVVILSMLLFTACAKGDYGAVAISPSSVAIESGQENTGDLDAEQEEASTDLDTADEDDLTYRGGMVEVFEYPDFSNEDQKEGIESFIRLSELDSLGRCGVAFASIGPDTLGQGERGEIGHIKPSGWHTVKYAGVDGNYLYNRCHLLAWCLTGLNDDERNLITGTRSFNVDAMLLYEEMVAKYVETTGNHVLYRVTPVFKDNELVARGVYIEALSIEDDGDLAFKIFCHNVQDGVTINYLTGESNGPEFLGGDNTSAAPQNQEKELVTINEETTFVVNTNTGKFHLPSCSSVADMSSKNLEQVTDTKEDVLNNGYVPCKNCNP